MMKANVLLSICFAALSGCSSNTGSTKQAVDYTTLNPAAVCAVLGELKISHKDRDFIRIREIVKNRITKHSFNITASACQDMATKAMIAYQLNKQIALVSDLPCVPEATAKT